MNLKFDTNVLAAAEESLRKPLVAILAELESEEGASLSTLRALVAAGTYRTKYPSMDFLPVILDEPSAGRLIDDGGTTAAAEAVGKALREFVEQVVK